MGESKLKRMRALEGVMPGALQTAGGRVPVRWEAESAATPMGQLAYFIEFLMAGLRLVVGAEVRAGDEHSGSHSLPGLLKILDALPPERRPNPAARAATEPCRQSGDRTLPPERRPKMVRGDCGFGSNPIMGPLEDRQQPYLFKLRLSKNVKRHIERVFWDAGWSDAGQALSQLYRDRADAENAFDELKNQWGWGGFTTHDLHRCQLSARAAALIYNWWSLFVRLANPQARREVITSRPWLMSSVGRKTEHAGQTTITLTGLHADFAKARDALMRVSALLQGWTIRAAEQLLSSTVWHLVCDHLKRVLAAIPPSHSRRILENHALGTG